MNKHSNSAADTREKIIVEATKLFNTNSYNSTSVNDIINAAGISKGGFYYHFPDKESLFFEIHVASLTNFIELIEAIKNRTDIPASKKIYELIVSMISYLLQDDEAQKYNTYVKELQLLSPEHQTQSLLLRRNFLYVIRDIVSEGINSGEFCKTTSPTDTAFAIIGMCMWTTNWFLPDRRKNIGQLSETFANIIVSGIKA